VVFFGIAGTADFSSEITISSSFTAECTENAEASENPSVDWNVLKLGDLHGDKSPGFRLCPLYRAQSTYNFIYGTVQIE
jgi:hypothetical protein